MPRSFLFAFVLVGPCLLASKTPAAEDVPGEVALIAAQDREGNLPGWKSFSEKPGVKTGDVWTLTADGVLACRGTPKGYLYTEKSYANFVLKLQWRTPPGKKPGSGGVLLRTTGEPKLWPKSLEAQLNAGSEGDFWGLDGYGLSGPAERLQVVPTSPFGKLTNLKRTKDAVKKPGEWNQYEIVAEGPVVTLKINGQIVNRATRCDTTAGVICLTAEGDEIQFRDVRLAPLRKPVE